MLIKGKDDFHKYLIEVAAQSKAKKRKVGAVIAYKYDDRDEYEIYSASCNHNPMNDGICEDENGNTYSTVIHAEVGAINIAKVWIETPNYFKPKLYVTQPPCDHCLAYIKSYGLEYEVMEDFLKFDTNKLRYDLVPPKTVEFLAKVLTYGAKKYKPNNWRKTKEPDRYIAATMRHIEAYRMGEKIDPESKLEHLAHALTNICFLLELDYVPEQPKNGE